MYFKSHTPILIYFANIFFWHYSALTYCTLPQSQLGHLAAQDAVELEHLLEGHGPVHEIQVQVVEPQVREGFPTGDLHIIRMVLGVPQLGGHEDLFPLQRLGEKHYSF